MARPSASQSGGPPTRSSTSTWPPVPSTAGTGAPAAASAVRPSASTSAGYGQRLTTTARPSARRPRVVLQMNPPVSGSPASSGGRPAGQSAPSPVLEVSIAHVGLTPEDHLKQDRLDPG